MGYDGKKVVEANRVKVVGAAREVGTFWGENAGVLIILGIVLFFLGVLALFTIFSPTAFLPQRDQKREEEFENRFRFASPLLFGRPTPPRPLLPWQKKDGITPIHWSGGHHGGHHERHHSWHGHHGHHYPHYYPSYPVRPWGWGRYGYGDLTDPNFSTRYWLRPEEKRPYLDMKMLPNGQLERYRSGFK